jgi:flavin-dependent dehydrogenase
MPKLYDVAILGVTPGGYAAAAALARKKRDVVVIDTPSESATTCPLMEWVPKTLLDLDEIPQTLLKEAGAVPFKKVRYVNADYSETSDYSSPIEAGYFLHPADLLAGLKARATKAGARTTSTSNAPALELQEDQVTVTGSHRTQARTLLIAEGRPSNILAMLSRRMPRTSLPPMTCVALDVPLGKGAETDDLDGVLHIVERPERSEMGMYFVAAGTVHVRIISTSAAAGNRAEELSGMLQGLQDAELLPQELSLGKAKGALWHPVAGMALEMETHEAKRCLLAGSAGGFADSSTGHTILPEIRSSLLAAETIQRALGAKDVQNELMTYREQWRESLAEYLRPPNTSLQMLLPLLFVNPRIVTRFTRCMLYGEEI